MRGRCDNGKPKAALRLPYDAGEITILPEEAELVRFIFQCYSTGATLGELTKALCRQEIHYYAGRTWNKNMVSRILEDGRYIGEKGYPALIEPE